MIKIRVGTFETNSSSVHTLVLSKDGFEACKIPVKRKKIDGEFKKFLVVRLSEFGKDYRLYNTQEEKLSYLVTISYLTDGGGCYDIDRMKETYAYQIMEKEICKYCNCDGFLIDENSIDEAGIDHQTLTDYYSVSDFESIMGIDYVTFVFNKYAALKTNCD